MTTISFAGGTALSAEIMRAMDDIAREQRKDHRDAALHEADVALHEGLEEAHCLRDQATSSFSGAVLGGSLTMLGGASQAFAAAHANVDTPETAQPTTPPSSPALAGGGEPAASTDTCLGGSSAVTPDAQATDGPASGMFRGQKESSLVNARATTPEGLRTGLLDTVRHDSSTLWNVVSISGSTTEKLADPVQKGFEASAGYDGARATEHRARAQAANRRADAEQSDAQDAQKMSDKARDLHQQILGLDHAARMSVLRG